MIAPAKGREYDVALHKRRSFEPPYGANDYRFFTCCHSGFLANVSLTRPRTTAPIESLVPWRTLTR